MSLDLPKRFLAAEYDWWRRALARDRKPVQDENPQCGVYRWAHQAVEIWRDPDLKQLVCVVDGVPYDMMLCKEHWVSISREPITLEMYRHHVKHGAWPGESAVANKVANTLAEVPKGAIGVPTSGPPGEAVPTNRPPEGPELLVQQLDELERDAKRLMAAGAAKDQATADEAAKLAGVIEKIEKQVDATHKAAKAPHIEAGKALDRVWFPLRDRAADLKKLLKATVIAPFLVSDQEKRDAESAALVAQGVEAAAITGKTAKASGYERTTALRSRKVAEITDYPALLMHLIDHPDIKAAAWAIANASARAGVALPGMKIKTIKSAV